MTNSSNDVARGTVRPGENIVSLSTRLTGSPVNFSTIIRLNDLKAPYITEEPHPHCLVAGDPILYPAPTAPAAPVSARALMERTFKRDIRAENGDLVLSGGNFTVQTGVENFKTALRRRVETLLGTHPFHPLYGSLLLLQVGRPADAIRMRLITTDVRRAIMRDPRVEDSEVRATWQNAKLEVWVSVTPIALGQTFEFYVYY